MSSNCHICGSPMTEDESLHQDCGGDCLTCMAEIGDIDCMTRVLRLQRKQIDALRDAALAVQKDAGWISVEERLPLESDGAVVVLLNSEEPAIAWATYWHGASNAFNCWLFPISGYYDDSDITHWMKLPAPPVSQQSEVK